jgi:hypothetical protein
MPHGPKLSDDPIDRLRWAASLARAVSHIHEGVADQAASCADWLEAAVRAHVYDGVPIDRAMGLAGAQGRQPRFYALLRERNSHLTRALCSVDGDVQELLSEIDRYESRVSALQRDRRAPDPLWSDTRKHIHAAALLGTELPRTVKGLQKTLNITSTRN